VDIQTRFVEGLALVDMLPGPGATQLGIFIGHAKAGLIGGIPTTSLMAPAAAYVDAFIEVIRWENPARLYDRYSAEG
jgi:chromate transport protein ChrA